MTRIYKRMHPKGSKYIRKTEYIHGREIVKPIERKDFDEMIRLCLLHRDSAPTASREYFRWYRNYVIMIVGVNTGNRITTICEQTPRDYAGRKFTITEHKTGKTMQFTMNADVYKIVHDYIDRYHIGLNEFMFRTNLNSRDSITRSGCWRFMKQLAEEAKVEYPIACHSLRKSFGRWKWDETHDLLLVSKLLMHDSPLETMRYICLEENDVDLAREQICNLPRYQ